MRRFSSILWGIAFILVFCGAAGAASEQAMKLRGQNGLSKFAPPEAFLSGNFLADETDPNLMLMFCSFAMSKRYCLVFDRKFSFVISSGLLCQYQTFIP